MLIESIPKEPLSFHIIPFDNPRMQYTVQAKSLDQKRCWCQELKRLILDNYSAAIPAKAKELVMMLGKSREEEGWYMDRNVFIFTFSLHNTHVCGNSDLHTNR